MRVSTLSLGALAVGLGAATEWPDCHENNCYRNLIDANYAAEASAFCPGFIAGTTTAATAIPTNFYNCDGSVQSVSSVCSCIVYTMTHTSATATAEPTTEPSVEPTTTTIETYTISETWTSEEPTSTSTDEDDYCEDDETTTTEPTATPTDEPTVTPTDEPTVTPTDEPTVTPTESEEPTATPTDSEEPTVTPTDEPTVTPTDEPTVTSTETEAPTTTDDDYCEDDETTTTEPTVTPTDEPTVTPTDTEEPTATPTDEPTEEPTEEPTATPTDTRGTPVAQKLSPWWRSPTPVDRDLAWSGTVQSLLQKKAGFVLTPRSRCVCVECPPAPASRGSASNYGLFGRRREARRKRDAGQEIKMLVHPPPRDLGFPFLTFRSPSIEISYIDLRVPQSLVSRLPSCVDLVIRSLGKKRGT
ncbi:Putative protein of unknown function [Podospora comata]|uniref:Uncharacterized protein n=1 Tax=Podospora comata TaxID=48703 RepID=A0ABY6SIA9_PODCO|nr:Putative protein of unknown function [Podospora comata]